VYRGKNKGDRKGMQWEKKIETGTETIEPGIKEGRGESSAAHAGPIGRIRKGEEEKLTLSYYGIAGRQQGPNLSGL